MKKGVDTADEETELVKQTGGCLEQLGGFMKKPTATLRMGKTHAETETIFKY